MPHSPLITRIRAEFQEMPGLSLTLAQTQRLCGGDHRSCEMALKALVEERFLQLRRGLYSLPSSVDREVEYDRHEHVHGTA